MAKIEENELLELKKLIAKPSQIATEIGMRVIAYNSINELIDQWKDAQKEQQDKLLEIEEKHGKGSLNIETGELTPLNEE